MKIRPTYSPSAFSLIEVTMALGIAAFCLLSVFGLLPLGLSNTQNAAEQTAVSGIASAISADLHSVSTIDTTGSNSSVFQIPIPGIGQLTNPQMHTLYFTSDGNLACPVDTNASGQPRYRATITIAPDPTLYGVNPRTTLYKVWVFVTWPALADPNHSVFPSNFSGSYEYITALNLFHN